MTTTKALSAKNILNGGLEVLMVVIVSGILAVLMTWFTG